MSQKDTKMNPKGAKGTQKVSPKSTKIQLKIATSKKLEKGGAPQHLFGSCLTYVWSKMRPKFNAKNYAEKTNKQKQK